MVSPDASGAWPVASMVNWMSALPLECRVTITLRSPPGNEIGREVLFVRSTMKVTDAASPDTPPDPAAVLTTNRNGSVPAGGLVAPTLKEPSWPWVNDAELSDVSCDAPRGPTTVVAV